MTWEYKASAQQLAMWPCARSQRQPAVTIDKLSQILLHDPVNKFNSYEHTKACSPGCGLTFSRLCAE
jgi:hypothetical protein